MAVYEFRDRSGRVHEMSYPVGKAPLIGTWVRLPGGVRAQRIPPSLGGMRVDKRSEGFVSNSLPRHWPYARDWDAQGKPRFSGRRDVEEAIARSRDTRHDHVEYD